MSGGEPSEPSEIRGLRALLRADGALRRGSGLLSSVLALALAVLSLLAVLAFHFPAYLTTPELRAAYDVELLRHLLAATLVISGGVSLVNLLLGRSRWLAAWAFSLVVVAVAFGGSRVPVDDFPSGTPYLGLDFLVLDLLASTLLFVFVEKLFGLRKDQPLFRSEWQVDLVHFTVNHLLVGLALLAQTRAVFALRVDASPWAVWSDWPLVFELLFAVLVADVLQYGMHRAYHEVPALWRVHAVHHSARHLDWLAGSRLHLLELLVTRVVVLVPLYLLGFSKAAIDGYIIVAGVQTVFNHANVSVRLGPLSYLVVTPNFHHWHHSQDDEAIDKNYAAHFAFLDHLFGTAVRADRRWPNRYGVLGDYVPLRYLEQLAFPFRGPRIRGKQVEKG